MGQHKPAKVVRRQLSQQAANVRECEQGLGGVKRGQWISIGLIGAQKVSVKASRGINRCEQRLGGVKRGRCKSIGVQQMPVEVNRAYTGGQEVIRAI